MGEEKKKKGKVKKFFGVLGIGLLAFGAYKGINKLEEEDLIDVGGGFHIDQVEKVNNVTFENNILEWERSKSAEEYVIKIDGEKYKTTDNYLNLQDYAPGTYDIKIKATAPEHRDSAYTELEDVVIYSQEQFRAEIDDVANKQILKLDPLANDIKLLAFNIENNNIKLFTMCTSGNDDKYLEFNYKINDNSSYADILKTIKQSNPTTYIIKCNSSNNVINFENAPVMGNLQSLINSGWNVTKLYEGVCHGGFDQENYIYYGQYYTYAKCEKDGEVKFIFQACKLKVDGYYSFIFNYVFEEGELPSNDWFQTEYIEYNNPEMVVEIQNQQLNN